RLGVDHHRPKLLLVNARRRKRSISSITATSTSSAGQHSTPDQGRMQGGRGVMKCANYGDRIASDRYPPSRSP
uniref:Uncharacterized protein n=1 Tax=Macrostomum lignano TaxID=282301 RepID=A0A1I8FJH3_9PLAT